MDNETLQKLISKVQSLRESPYSDFYAHKYRELPTDLKADSPTWESIPFLEREEIYNTPLSSRLFVDQKEVSMVRVTSGTSGRGVLIMPKLQNTDWAQLSADLFEAYQFSRAASFSGSYFRSIRPYGHRYGVDFVALDLSDLSASASIVHSFKPDLLYGFGYALEALGQELDVADRKLIRGLYLFGERISQLRWEQLRKAYPNAALLSEYSNVDAQAIIGLPCSHLIEQHSRYVHAALDHMHFEVINPDTGELVKEAGEVGEVVLTSLSEVAFPLVRYRTGDIAKIIEASCPCGSRSPVYSIEGRLGSEKVRFQGGEVQLAEVERAVQAAVGLGPAVSIVSVHLIDEQATAGITPRLTLSLQSVDESLPADLAQKISSELRVGPSTSYAEAVTSGKLLPLQIELAKTTLAKNPGIITST